MVLTFKDTVERETNSAASISSNGEKNKHSETFHLEGNRVSAKVDDETLFKLSEPGQACTDEKGTPLVVLDENEEARLRRKIDFRLVPILAFVHLVSSLDRSNIGNAKIAGLEEALKMDGLDYNFLMMSYSISHCVAVLPMVYLVKRLGPGKVLPAAIVCFGILTIFFAFVHSFRDAVIVRVLLAIFEAPMGPGLAFYLSRFYRRAELAVRISLYIIAAPIAGAVGGVLCGGILRLHAIGSFHRWQMIFVIEGIATTVIGIVAYLLLSDSIEKANWLAPRDKALGIVRIKSENVSTTGIVDAVHKRTIKRGMTSITALMVGFANSIMALTSQSMGYLLPTIIRTIFPNRSTTVQQLLTSPPYFVAAILTLVIAFSVKRWPRLTVFMMLAKLIGVIGYVIASTTTVQHQPHARYAAAFFVVSCSYVAAPVSATWTLVNNASDTERAGAILTHNLLHNLAHIVAAFAYVKSDAPNYHRISTANSVLCSVSLLMIGLCGIILRRENVRRTNGERDYRLDGMSIDEHEKLGHHHPSFRYQY